MVMKSAHSDHRLQAHLYGDECQAHLARVEADLAEEYPVAFKRDLLALIQAISRFIDDSIVSPRLPFDWAGSSAGRAAAGLPKSRELLLLRCRHQYL